MKNANPISCDPTFAVGYRGPPLIILKHCDYHWAYQDYRLHVIQYLRIQVVNLSSKVDGYLTFNGI